MMNLVLHFGLNVDEIATMIGLMWDSLSPSPRANIPNNNSVASELFR